MAQTVRVTRELFLSDPDLRRALGVSATTIILKIERKIGSYKGRGRSDQWVDFLEGCLITVFDPEEVK